MFRRTWRIAAVVLSLTLMGGGSALAEPGPANSSNPALINPTAEVQLQIHKYLGLPLDQTQFPADGRELTITGRDSLIGVPFEIFKVGNINLGTNDGWQAATALAGHVVTANEILNGIVLNGVTYPLSRMTTVFTDATGTAKFTKPDGVGLYWVRELRADASGYRCTKGAGRYPLNYICYQTSSGGEVQVNAVTLIRPFFITLPLTNPVTNNAWLYDVHIYPKNQSDTITKTVKDEGTVMHWSQLTNPMPTKLWPRVENNINAAPNKNVLVYTLTSSISANLDGPTMGKYVIKDRIQAFDSITESIKIVNSPTLGAEQPLVAGSDYVFEVTKLDSWATNDFSGFTISMTADGLLKLAAAKAANSAAQVVSTISVARDAVFFEAANQAALQPNQFAGELVSNAVISYYFSLEVLKYDPAFPITLGDGNLYSWDPEAEWPSSQQPDLSGAEFSVYFGGNPETKKCTGADIQGKTPIATAPITNKKSDGTPVAKVKESGGTYLLHEGFAYNKVSFGGLPASNWLNGVEIPVERRSEWITYCVVEKKAPAGYQLNPEPIYAELLVTPAGMIGGVQGSGYRAPAYVSDGGGAPQDGRTLPLANVKVGALPLTGGAGAAALGIAGVLLIGGGIGYYAITARRRRN